MVRKFLYLVAGCVFLILAAGVAWTLYSAQLMRIAMVPSAAFVTQSPAPPQAYDSGEMWLARPGIAANPARWLPGHATSAPIAHAAAVFFIHPTSYFNRASWNAPLNNAVVNDRSNLFIRGQATIFNGTADIWAPKYRQAAFGAFLTDQPEATKAIDAAYADVTAAWDAFLRQVGPDRPIIVAGHSQGAMHLVRLLKDRIAGKPIARRIVAAYVVGWPISVTTDLPTLGLPACAHAEEAGCILSWQSFAEPADPDEFNTHYANSIGLNGHPRRETPMLCTNPLTGTPGATAPASANHGTLIPAKDMSDASVQPGLVPARCDARGFLLIGAPPPGIDTYVLPGNNYHVFDFSLFWTNLREDVARRLATFQHGGA